MFHRWNAQWFHNLVLLNITDDFFTSHSNLSTLQNIKALIENHIMYRDLSCGLDNIANTIETSMYTPLT